MTQEMMTRDQMEAVAAEELQRIVELVGTAESLTIVTDDQYQAADDLLARLKGAFKASDEKRVEIKAPYLEETRAIDGAWRSIKEAYDRGENVVKAAMLAFRRKREEEAERAAAALREKEAKERAKLLERAEKADERGRERQAETLREQAMTMPVATVVPNIPKTGTSYRKVWRWEVLEPDKIDRKFLIPNEKAITALVESLGERAAETVGGINVFQAEIAVAPRGR